MEKDSEEISKGNVSMKSRKLCRVRLTPDVAKKLTLSHHKGNQRVAFILDEPLFEITYQELSRSAGCINVSPKSTKSLTVFLS